jgi:hypothetical protein
MPVTRHQVTNVGAGSSDAMDIDPVAAHITEHAANPAAAVEQQQAIEPTETGNTLQNIMTMVSNMLPDNAPITARVDMVEKVIGAAGGRSDVQWEHGETP